MTAEAYVTLLYSDNYERGAIVLAHRLARLDPSRDRVVLVTPQIPPDVRARLARVFTKVVEVEPVFANAHAELKLLDRPELDAGPTKIHVWSLPYEHVVYLDADTLPVADLGALFELVSSFPDDTAVIASSPDIGWPDIFNSGVFATRPSAAVHSALHERAKRPGSSFDGSDQGLLNDYFGESGNQPGTWLRLPFLYNVTLSSAYQYVPAYRKFKDDIKVVHFIGAQKPWLAPTEGCDVAADLYAVWKQAESEAFPDHPAEPHEQYADYDPDRVIPPPVHRWEPAEHAPLANTPAEAPAMETLSLGSEDGDQFVYPEFGPSVAKLPYEDDQTPAERIF